MTDRCKSSRVVLARRAKAPFLKWGPLRAVLREILGAHEAGGILSVALVGDEEIRRIHREFLHADSTTDVISFRLDEGPSGGPDDTLGEVVISAETAERVAVERGLAPDRELALYAIHGTLHLVGFDDISAGSRRVMRRKEREYLARYDELG